MSWPKAGLLAALVLLNIAFVVGWWRAARTHPHRDRPTVGDVMIGFVTDFFDALGIGSYAPTTALFKLRGRPADELIPGTLNVGKNASAFVETAIFVTAVAVDPILLVAMIGSATLGAWFGAGAVSRLPRRTLQLFMGSALMVAATLFAVANLGGFPVGGTAMGLFGWRFGIAVGVNCALGAFLSAGIGVYAPCMVLLALLGLHPLAAYPIMMGTCGLVEPVASLRFFKTGRFAWGPSLGLTLGGVLGVLVAVFVVKQLPLRALRWLVMVVVAYAAISMLRSGFRALAREVAEVPTPAESHG